MRLIGKNLYFAVVLAVGSAAFVLAQDAETPQSTLEKVAGDVYLVSHIRGGNVAVFLGGDGAFVVDAGTTAEDAERIQAAVAGMTDQPIAYVVNTHWHSDHVGGNEGLRKAGATIVAHEKVAERMAAEQYLEFFDQKRGPAPAAALPQITFTSGLTFSMNGEEIEVRGDDEIEYDGEVHSAANLFDALKEGYYGKF